MRNPLSRFTAGNQGSASLIAALVLVALVPAVCVLWFMTVAMRNERLAVQDRLTDVYLTHLAVLRQQLTTFWQDREADLAALGAGSPAETFARIVRANLADSVVVCDPAGKVFYPAMMGVELPESGDAKIARRLQMQVAELLKAGETELALKKAAELAGDPNLRDAVGTSGALMVPNAQLLVLKTLAGTEAGGAFAALRQRTLEDLVKRLNDYADHALASSQRRFLMAELSGMNPDLQKRFPTLTAEELAADYLERDPAPVVAGVADPGPASARPATLQRTPLAKIWRLPVAGGTVVALFREKRLKEELAARIEALALPDVRVTVLAPGEAFATTRPMAPQEIGEVFPGWRFGLVFRGGDPLAEASARQARFYLWTGVGVVAIIALLALLVARYVAAQMRLARLKNELVSTVSHELRTPLASMRALVDTLAAGRLNDDQQRREYLELIARENLRLTHLIENFLTFSRLERGKQGFRFEDLAPGAVVETAVDALKKRLGSVRCDFTIGVAPDLPRIRADGDALATVLINLLDNACKYTRDEKRIALRAFAAGRWVCFEVADNGIGLDRREARKIFDRFYQVDQSLTRQQGGCGLGLSIVKFIVDAHGGTVSVESETGRGSTFRVRIPIANQARTETESP